MNRCFPQAAVLLPPPSASRSMEFELRSGTSAEIVRDTIQRFLSDHPGMDGTAGLVGFGPSLVETLSLGVPSLRAFPEFTGGNVQVKSTQAALWVWLRGSDRGELFWRGRAVEEALGGAFERAQDVDTFVYDTGRDLSGYEDGTENPQGEDATDAAIVPDSATALSGSSFVAVQKWEHDFQVLGSMSKRQQDLTIGRERTGNEELDDAPPSAHVKRTAQENFDPPSFVVRRSMPWATGDRGGLLFVAFGSSLDAYERQLRRMVGLDDGTTDALFTFTRPVSGSYYWCPPVVAGRISIST